MTDIKKLLDEKYLLYNNPAFIATDPIQIPHQFELREDIEIAAFLTATIAWGQRASIIKNAQRLMLFMNNQPFKFISDFTDADLKPFKHFVHRTFQGDDCNGFLKSLQHIYKNCGGLQGVFTQGYMPNKTIYGSLAHFRKVFFEVPHLQRTTKHVSDVMSNSSAKRLNMFLRWMVRSDSKGVDFGLWKTIPASALHLPLDLHTGNISRQLGLLQRKQNDWKAVEEITSVLQSFDPNDPIKYDFALFGMGAFE